MYESVGGGSMRHFFRSKKEQDFAFYCRWALFRDIFKLSNATIIESFPPDLYKLERALGHRNSCSSEKAIQVLYLKDVLDFYELVEVT